MINFFNIIDLDIYLTFYYRGKVTITRDGKRHVSYGRGYTSYEIPEPHPETEIMIKKIYDKRFNVIINVFIYTFNILVQFCSIIIFFSFIIGFV